MTRAFLITAAVAVLGLASPVVAAAARNRKGESGGTKTTIAGLSANDRGGAGDNRRQ